MESSHVSTIIDLLSSGKLKERSQGLDELTTLLKQDPEKLPVKYLYTILQILVDIIEIERSKHERLTSGGAPALSESKLTAIENRLSSAAYVLRVLVQATACKFKSKHLRFLITLLPSLIANPGTEELSASTSVHLLWALDSLISSECFELKFEPHQWTTLVQKLTSYLSLHLDQSLSNKNIYFLLRILNSLLLLDSASLPEVESSFVEPLAKFLHKSQNENSNTKILLQLINVYILKTHLINYFNCLEILELTMRFSLRIRIFNTSGVEREFAIFNLFLCSLINSDVLKVMQTGQQGTGFDQQRLFRVFEDYVIAILTDYDPANLNQAEFQFKQVSNKMEWLEYKDFQLHCDFETTPCLKMFGIAQMIRAYFCINGSRNTDEGLLFKKTKKNESLDSFLKDAMDPVVFITRCIESSIKKFQLFGLQACGFFASNFNMEQSQLDQLGALSFQKFEDTQLQGWACFALVPLVSDVNSQLPANLVQKIFHLCLPLIKFPDLCRSACALARSLIKFYSRNLLADFSIAQQVNYLYQLSDVNGPALLNDETFEFWMYLYTFECSRKSRVQDSACTRTISWLLSKWNQLDLKRPDQTHFHTFVAWLAGKNDLHTEESERVNFLPQCDTYYTYWQQFSVERCFLLGNSNSNGKDIKKAMDVPQVLVESMELSQVLTKFSTLASNPDSDEIWSIRWCCEGVKLNFDLIGDQQFADHIKILDYEIQLVASNLCDPQLFLSAEPLNEVLHLKSVSTRSHVFLSNLNVSNILRELKSLILAEELPSSSTDQLDGFENSREFRSQSTTPTPHPKGFQAFGKYVIEHVLRLLSLTGSSLLGNDDNEKLLNIVEFLDGLPDRYVVQSVPYITTFLNSVSRSDKSLEQLERLTQILGAALLSTKYNTSNVSMSLLAMYLDSTRWAWLSGASQRLQADSGDILDWLLAKLNENSFCAAWAVLSLSKLLLNLLRFQDFSTGKIVGGKQKVFGAFINCIRRLPFFMINGAVEGFQHYVSRISTKNQMIAYAEISDIFASRADTLEIPAFHAMILANMGAVSSYQAIRSTLDMLNQHKDQFALHYAKRCFDDVAHSSGMEGRQELFHLYRFEVIEYWYERSLSTSSADFDSWQICVFGFTSLQEFLKCYCIELSAFYFSKKIKLHFVIKGLCEQSGEVEKHLLENCLHLSIPLCHISTKFSDNLIKQHRDTLGRRYNQIVGELAREICYWFLYFTKWELSDELQKTLKSLFPKSGLPQRLLAHLPSFSRSQTNLQIPASTSLNLLKAHIDAHSMDERDVSYLLARLSADLSETISPGMKISILREMKCLLILFESSLRACSYLPRLVGVLAANFKFRELQTEALDLVSCIIGLGLEQVAEVAEMYSATFACLLAEHTKFATPLIESLEQSLSHVCSTNIPDYSETWKSCLRVLKGEVLGNSVYLNDELLKIVEASEIRFLLLSQLFEYHPEPTPFDLQFHYSHQVANNLFDLSRLNYKTSPHFDLWRGYYIGGYYLKYARIPGALKRDNNVGQLYDNSYTPLRTLMENLKLYRDKTLDARPYFAINSVFSFASTVLAKEKVDPRWNTDMNWVGDAKATQISSREFHLLPTVQLGASDDRGLRSYMTCLHDIPYNQWISCIMIKLSCKLDSYLPCFSAFKMLKEQRPQLIESMLFDMFFILEDLDHKTGVTQLLQFLMSFKDLSGDHNIKDFNSKATLLLRLFSVVRSASKNCKGSLAKVYEALDLEHYYRLASKVGMATLAYMLFEEYSSNDNCPSLQPLQSVFEAIGDADLMQALPIEPSLDYAFSSVGKYNARSFKNFMFNNCKFDVNSILRKGPNMDELVETSNINGFSGLAEIVSNVNSKLSSRGHQEAYQWSLRLSKWDLPLPDRCSSASDALYSLSKKIYANPSDALKISKSHLKKVVADAVWFNKKNEWAGTLSTVLCSELFNLHHNDPVYLKSLLDQIATYDAISMERRSFFDHELEMKARHSLLSLSNNDLTILGSRVELKCCEFLELVNYANASRENKALQEFLTAAVLLENKARDLDITTKNGSWKRLALFQGAQALWLQKEHQISISILENLVQNNDANHSGTLNLLEESSHVSQVRLKALLVEWTSLQRKHSAHSIYTRYIADTTSEISEVGDYSDRAEIYLKFGEFCFQQVRRLEGDETVNERRKRSEQGNAELLSVLEIVKDSGAPDQDRKDAKKHYNRLRLQVEQDQNMLVNLAKQQQLFTWKSVHFYLSALVYGSQLDEDVLDKFCGLWFQYAEDGELNSKLYHEISSIPSFKFLPWIYQLTSRLSIDTSPFQRNLQLTLKRVMFKLPNETLYPLVSLRLYKRYQSAHDPSIAMRVKAVEKLFNELGKYDNGQFFTSYLEPIQEFCEMSVELSSMKLPKSCRSINLANLKSGSYWLDLIKRKGLSLPTSPVPIACSADGRKPRATITHLDPTVDISSSGLSLPKIASFCLSDGSKHKVLMKGSNDDLRQDSIMEQVFKQVNQILLKDKQTRKKSLRIRTYEVVPLGPQAGLIEFVPNSISLHEVLNKLHKKDDLTFDRARKMMKQAQSKSFDERVDVFIKICNSVKPRLRGFFFDSFHDPQGWLDAKYAFTKGVVTNSIVGYILGLGDRHLNNILIDKSNGEPVHIDLGVAFDQGRLLPIPELVPFRLTRDIVDGFGVTGVEGVFRSNCERVYSVLHSERERVMNVLNVLKWDPLYSWVVSPLRKRKLQANISDDSEEFELGAGKATALEDNNESMRALKDVQNKLEGSGLSVEATIQELIHQATDVGNLATIYMGWSPFY
ncbi:LANO_0F11958g1_1 [Lachancea nothofagi CBS 11611]|uniref:Serine/threonine-protein kinase Tel1 n=1 Tax=Lachancea nothofagi CBS 11611 TaxID=1266666 RepID=A0A1G4KB49_9SACH|nr:LANO_0F11958g1_1 [Lachancea nothofagi CBS 11611]